MVLNRIVSLWVLGVAFIPQLVITNTSDGHAVYDLLFANESRKYNRNVRPVTDWDTAIIVRASVSVIAIVEFDEVKQTIILTCKLTLSWTDIYLTWDPSLYGNVTHIHVPQNMVWRPAIFLENSVAKQEELGSPSMKVVIENTGAVTWEPVEVFHATCAADVRKFPFDTQKCSLMFEAMGYSGNEMQIVSVEDHIDFHGYGGTSGWKVTETDMETETDSEGNTHLFCSLTMSRNPTYFILNIFLPIILLTFMNTFVFILPAQSGEKVSFAITVFLSLAVFLTIVGSNLPENTDTISILNVYVFISTLLGVMVTILTIFVVRIYHNDDNIPVTNTMKRFTLKFTSQARYKKIAQINVIHETVVGRGVRRTSIVPMPVVEENINTDTSTIPKEDTMELTNILVTWPDVARAFDNLFLVVFILTNIIMTIVVFTIAVSLNEAVQEDSH